VSYDAEIERIVAEHAAASARIWAEIARIDAESAWRSAELAERVRVEAEAAVANEAGGTEPKSPQPAKRLPPLADDWDNDEESKYYRPKSWLI
jgi:hypothetical protein